MSPRAAPTDPSPWPPRPLPVPDPAIGLRVWQPGDAAVLAAAWSDPEIRSWLQPPDAEIDTARTWIDGEPERRAQGLALDLVIVADGVVAGEVGLSHFDPARRACLIGYWAAPGFRGRGLVRRATAAAADWALGSLGAVAVVAECAPQNLASHRVVEAAGFGLLSADHRGRRVYAKRAPS